MDDVDDVDDMGVLIGLMKRLLIRIRVSAPRSALLPPPFQVLENFERAALLDQAGSDEAEKKRLLSFMVVGGGPTGVEAAAEVGGGGTG